MMQQRAEAAEQEKASLASQLTHVGHEVHEEQDATLLALAAKRWLPTLRSVSLRLMRIECCSYCAYDSCAHLRLFSRQCLVTFTLFLSFIQCHALFCNFDVEVYRKAQIDFMPFQGLEVESDVC
jgi:hypothetical protein